MKLLIYTFWIPRGNIAQSLFKLKDILPQNCKILYVSGERGLKTLINQIILLKPDFILGLGYKNSKNIIAEQNFRNIYGKKELFKEEAPVLNSNWDIISELKLPPEIKILTGSNAGLSHCNQYAYCTARIIQIEKLNSKFAYLHIPNKLNSEVLTVLWESVIGDIKD